MHCKNIPHFMDTSLVWEQVVMVLFGQVFCSRKHTSYEVLCTLEAHIGWLSLAKLENDYKKH